MPGTTAFPGALDSTTTLPTASTLSGIELDGDGTANNIHSNVHGVTGGAVIALETKLGSGATTPTATAVLVGSGTGTSAWDTTPTFGDVSIADGKGLVVGHTAGDTTMWAAYATPEFQVLGTAADSGIGAVRYSADAFGPMIGMGKSRHADLAGNTIVADNDILGKLIWFGADGNAAATIGAEVFARVNGTPGNGDMPTELVFATTADGASTATERLLIDAAGDVGIGIATPDSNLHVQTATAGAVAAVANTVLTVENSTHAYLSILTPNDTVGGIVFGDVASNVAGRLLYTHDPASPQGFQFYVEASARMRLDSTGTLFVGDTANANMTQGLTINQGAADNQILALKSSDVAHGLTSNGFTAMETDDYHVLSKVSATLGGMKLDVVAEDAALGTVLQVGVAGGTATTTKSTSGVGLEHHYIMEHNGSNARANVTADGNIFGVSAYVGGAFVTRWLLDEDGDTWQSGGATFGGDVTLGENGIILDHAIGTDLAVSGITTTGTAGSSMVVGDVIVLSADNAWDPANADSAAADALGTGMLGIALTAGSSGAINILLQVFIRVDAVYGFTSAGLPLYLDDTAGDMSQTAPSASGDFVRIVGYAHDDDDTIYFNPDNTWVEVA